MKSDIRKDTKIKNTKYKSELKEFKENVKLFCKYNKSNISYKVDNSNKEFLYMHIMLNYLPKQADYSQNNFYLELSTYSI